LWFINLFILPKEEEHYDLKYINIFNYIIYNFFIFLSQRNVLNAELYTITVMSVSNCCQETTDNEPDRNCEYTAVGTEEVSWTAERYILS
jgi:hypothetical protein